ncbi:RecB family exonuclease [Lentibacillus juripiscarius]
MMIFSFSRLNLYKQCPNRFYNKYVLEKDEPMTQPLALGKAVHKAIEDKINGIPHQESILNGYAEANFHEELTQSEIADLVEKAPVQSAMGDTETYFKLKLADEANAPQLQGFIDLIQPNGRITDWKTNRVPYKTLDNHQLALYAWVVSQLKGLHSVEGCLYFIRFRKESNHVFTPEEMEQARQWALDTANEINGRLALLKSHPDNAGMLFPAHPSKLCRHCPFAWECLKNNSNVLTSHGV